MQKGILNFYQEELDALSNEAFELARDQPYLNSFVSDTGEDILDPQVRQLLEGVAFLNSRVRCQLEDSSDRIGAALLELLCPHYMSPLPSMSIMQLTCNDSLQKPNVIPKGQMLESNSMSGTNLGFQTCYDIHLIPATVTDVTTDMTQLPIAGDEFKANLGVKITCQNQNLTFAKLRPGRLRFYLNGDRVVIEALYRQLLEHSIELSLIDISNSSNVKRKHIMRSSVVPVGFTRDQQILPIRANVLLARQLLTEFFCYTNKFWFIDVVFEDLNFWDDFGTEVYLVWHMGKRLYKEIRQLSKEFFQLNCVPIINLFSKTAQGITLDHKRSEYPIDINNNKQHKYQIYSIDKVIEQDSNGNLIELPRLYSVDSIYNTNKALWWSTRKLTNTDSIDLNSQMYLSFTDKKADNALIDSTIITETTCCNGSLPYLLAIDNKLPKLQFVDPPAPIASLSLLTQPTQFKYHPIYQKSTWHFVAQAALKQVDLSESDNIMNWLTALFNLYEFADRKYEQMLRKKIKSIKSTKVLGRLPQLIQNNFCYGMRVTLELTNDDDLPPHYLFMRVLDEFLVQFSQLNTFSQLIIKDTSKVIKKWPARSMTQLVI